MCMLYAHIYIYYIYTVLIYIIYIHASFWFYHSYILLHIHILMDIGFTIFYQSWQGGHDWRFVTGSWAFGVVGVVWLLDVCEAIHKFEVVELLSCIPYLKLTVSTWNTGVGRWVSFWGPAFCQVLWLLVLGSVFLANSPSGTTLSKHIILGMTPWWHSWRATRPSISKSPG